MLLLRLLLGLEPDAASRELRGARGCTPAWAEGLRLDGVRAFGRSWDVCVENGQVVVEEAAA